MLGGANPSTSVRGYSASKGISGPSRKVSVWLAILDY